MNALSLTLDEYRAPPGLRFGWLLIRDQSSAPLGINGAGVGVALLSLPLPWGGGVEAQRLLSGTRRPSVLKSYLLRAWSSWLAGTANRLITNPGPRV
jgi:hypothetical protein